MFKKFGEFLIMLVMLGFLFYLVVYIVMGFPLPQWLSEAPSQIHQQIQIDNNY